MKYLQMFFNKASGFLIWVMLIVAIIACGIFAYLRINQIRPQVVLTGSMTPVLLVNDLTFSDQIKASEAKVGDIVTFQDPKNPRTITHRVTKIQWDKTKKKFHFTTKGDANKTYEDWYVRGEGIIGRYTYRIPKIGGFFKQMEKPMYKGMLFISLTIVLMILIIGIIWTDYGSVEKNKSTYSLMDH